MEKTKQNFTELNNRCSLNDLSANYALQIHTIRKKKKQSQKTNHKQKPFSKHIIHIY